MEAGVLLKAATYNRQNPETLLNTLVGGPLATVLHSDHENENIDSG